MPLIDYNGRLKSVKTFQEDYDELQKELADLSPDELVMLESALQDIDQQNDDDESVLSTLLDIEYKERPVGISTFLDDPYFLGKFKYNTAQQTGLFPKLREDLIELFEGQYCEATLSGSIALDSIIYEADGGLPTLKERIDDYQQHGINKDVTILLHEEKTSKTEPAHHSGIKTTRKVTLDNGMLITLTPDHKLHCWRDGEIKWVESQYLKKGDMVAVIRKWTTQPSANLSIDEARLLGYWCGDGCSDNGRSRYADGNRKTVDDVCCLMRKLGFTCTEPYETNSSDKCWEVHSVNFATCGFRDFLKHHNLFGPKTHTVTVPAEVLRSSNEVVAAFLNALWACEGSIYCNPSKSVPRLQLGMASERFIRQIQASLFRFGIQARICPITHKSHIIRKTGKTVKESHGWLLVVQSVENIKLFVDHIGEIPGKEKGFNRIKEYAHSRKANTNVDVIPFTWGSVKEIFLKNNLNISFKGFTWLCGNKNLNKPLSRYKFANLLKLFGNIDDVARLEKVFPSDVGYARVKSNIVSDKIEVGDIGAYTGNRFIGNGISVKNSLGFGKSTFSEFAIPWMIYQTLCLRDPQESLGLMKGSEIVFGILSLDLQQAKRGIFNGITEKLSASPYFKTINYKVGSNQIMFPDNIQLMLASPGSPQLIGMNVLGATCDEVNFFEGKRGVREGVQSTAGKVFTTLIRRVRSRFMKRGKMLGVVIVASSKSVIGAFTEERIKAARKDPTIFVAEYATWDTWPIERFNPERFHVLVGDDQCQSRILLPEEVSTVKREISQPDRFARVIEIPTDFKKDFEDNIDDAIRDQAGIATITAKAFLGRRDKIDRALKREFIHPFSVDVFTCGGEGEFLWDLICNKTMNRLKGGYSEEGWIPKINPQAIRYAHIDASSGKEDPAGIAIGHIGRWVDVVRRMADGSEYMDLAPEIWIDFCLRIVAPQNGEIFIPELRTFIYDMKAHGFNIMHVSTDRWSAPEMRQHLEKQGMTTQVISATTSSRVYDYLKTSIYEDRLVCYNYQVLRQELIHLEQDTKTGIVSHPYTFSDGSKGTDDVAIATASLVCSLTEKPPTRPMGMIIAPPSSRIEDDESWVLPRHNLHGRSGSVQGFLRNKKQQSPLIFGFED